MAEPAAEELTPEELKAMGFLLPEEAKAEVSADDLAAMGFEAPPAPIQPPEVGPKETFALRGAGAVPLGGLVTDLLGTGIIQGAKALGVGKPSAVLTPQAQAELYQMATQEGLSPDEAQKQIRWKEDALPGPVDTYRQLRDTRRLRTEEGSKQNPWSGRAGAATGLLASLLAPLPKVAVGPMRGIPLVAADPLARIASAGLTGGAYGAVNGLADGDADLTQGEVGQAIKDTVSGGVGGLLLGTAAGVAGEAARPLWPWLQEKAINAGRRVIGGDSDIAAATRNALSDEAVLQALAEKQIRPFSTTPATYQRLDQAAETMGAEYGQILQRLEELGVTGPRAVQLAAAFMRRANEMRGSMAASNTAPKTMAKEARNLAAHGQNSENLPLQTAESLKRDFQRMGRYERINNSPNEEAFQELGSTMRQAIENEVAMAGKAGGPGSEVAGLADRFGPLKARLSNTIAARDVGEKGASKALQKSPVGLKDMLLGAAAKDPGTAAFTALVSSGVRNRLPSTVASGAYGLSQALRSGSASPKVAQMVELALTPNVDDVQALIDALRSKKDKK